MIRSVLTLNDEGGDKIGPVILHGRPDKGMPGFPMTEAQIKDIAAFQWAPFDGPFMASGEIVISDRKVASSRQHLARMRADITGAARDENDVVHVFFTIGGTLCVCRWAYIPMASHSGAVH